MRKREHRGCASRAGACVNDRGRTGTRHWQAWREVRMLGRRSTGGCPGRWTDGRTEMWLELLCRWITDRLVKNYLGDVATPHVKEIAINDV